MCEMNVFLQFHLTLDEQTHSTSVKCVLNCWGLCRYQHTGAKSYVVYCFLQHRFSW